MAGRLEEAYVLAERALALTHERQERGNRRMFCVSSADIAARRELPEITLAEAHYHQALALAEELGMRPFPGPLPTGVSARCMPRPPAEPAHTRW